MLSCGREKLQQGNSKQQFCSPSYLALPGEGGGSLSAYDRVTICGHYYTSGSINENSQFTHSHIPPFCYNLH